MKKLILVLALVLLVGCGSGNGGKKESTTKVCSLDSGASSIVKDITITHKDGKISEIIYEENSALAAEQFESKTAEELEELFKAQHINSQREQPGMEFEISVDEKEKTLHVKVTIDPSKATLLDLNAYNLTDDLDLEKQVKNLESASFECKDK